jgi:DnaJ family protein C protein 28
MGDWLDEIIEKAKAEGHFDNLPGHGKPLKLDDGAHEDPAMRLANRILKDNGFLWPWIEERQEIEAAIETARAELAVAHHTAAETGQPPLWSEAAAAFRQKITALNRRIAAHNLKVPSPGFQRLPLDAEKEIARIATESTSQE